MPIGSIKLSKSAKGITFISQLVPKITTIWPTENKQRINMFHYLRIMGMDLLDMGLLWAVFSLANILKKARIKGDLTEKRSQGRMLAASSIFI